MTKLIRGATVVSKGTISSSELSLAGRVMDSVRYGTRFSTAARSINLRLVALTATICLVLQASHVMAQAKDLSSSPPISGSAVSAALQRRAPAPAASLGSSLGTDLASLPPAGGKLTAKLDPAAANSYPPTRLAGAPLPGDPNRARRLAYQAGELALNRMPEYILAPGDKLVITDYSLRARPYTDLPFVGSEIPVLPDGTAEIYPVGVISVAGMSLRQLNQYVHDKAKELILEPMIFINVSHQRPTQVYVLGEVFRPGIYSTRDEEIKTPRGVESASQVVNEPLPPNVTVMGAIEHAGGLTDMANITEVRVTRPRLPEPIVVNLWKLVADGDVSQDILLQTGDSIYVPKGGPAFNARAAGMVAMQQRRVRILGAVKKPGVYDLQLNDDVITVISRAEGFVETAHQGYVTLARTNRDGSITKTRLSMKDTIDNPNSLGRTVLQSGDAIIVDDSLAKRIAGKLGYALAATLPFATYATIQPILLRRVPDVSASSRFFNGQPR